MRMASTTTELARANSPGHLVATNPGGSNFPKVASRLDLTGAAIKDVESKGGLVLARTHAF